MDPIAFRDGKGSPMTPLRVRSVSSKMRKRLRLVRQDASPEEAEHIIEMVSRVRKRRNFFAHTLTGSYWDQRAKGEMFTSEAMDDTLFTVAETAIALEAVTD